MKNFRAHVLSDKVKWIITAVLFVVLIGLVIGLTVRLNNNETSKTLTTFNYEIGAIDTTTGSEIDSQQSIRQKSLANVDGMKIEVAEDSQVTYKVLFYDEEETFVSATSSLSGDFAEEVPETAEYFKIVITPNEVDGEPVTVSVFNCDRYSQMLTVSYNK